MAALICPTYVFYLEVLFKGNIEEHIIINKIKDLLIENVDNALDVFTGDESRNDASTQTFERSINEKILRNLEVTTEGIEAEEVDSVIAAGKEVQSEMILSITKLFKHFNSFSIKEYLCLHEYSQYIAEDGLHKISKKILLWIFSILNLAVIGYDIYRYLDNKSSYFLASIIIRILFFPLTSYFHIGTAFIYRAKDATLRNIIYLISCFTIVILLASVAGFVFSIIYQDTVRIKSLPLPSTYNTTFDYHSSIDNLVCRANFNGISMIDSIGYALGPYDVDRDKEVFNNQMGFFFGDDWQDFISYEVFYIHKNVPVIVYNNTKQEMLVFGFRGFSSGPELSLQIEMFAAQYVIPFFQDMMPFYNAIVDTFIHSYAKFAHNFGLMFFDPKAIIVNFVDPLIEICEKKNVTSNDRVLFTGINIGGMFAKVLGMLNHKQAVSFLSLPVFNDFVVYNYELEDEASTYLTNIYNIGGLFSLPEDGVSNNLGIPWVPDNFETIKSCSNKGICELATEKDSVYRSFCTLVDMCGKVDQFGHYCESIIGETYIDHIHQAIHAEDN